MGDCATAGWKVKNASKVEFYDGSKWRGVSSEDLRDVCAKKTLTVKLRVTDKGGGTHERSAKITVDKLFK